MKSSKEGGVKAGPRVAVVVGSNRVGADRVGRPGSLSGEKLRELLSVYYSRPYSLRRLGDMFGVSRMAVWRAVQSAQSAPR